MFHFSFIFLGECLYQDPHLELIWFWTFISAVLISVFHTEDERWGFEIPGSFSPSWWMTPLLPSLAWNERAVQHVLCESLLNTLLLENKVIDIKLAMSSSYQLVLQRFRGWLVLLPDRICFRAFTYYWSGVSQIVHIKARSKCLMQKKRKNTWEIQANHYHQVLILQVNICMTILVP